MVEPIAVITATAVNVKVAGRDMFTLEQSDVDGKQGYQMLASHEWASKEDLKLSLRATLEYLERGVL